MRQRGTYETHPKMKSPRSLSHRGSVSDLEERLTKLKDLNLCFCRVKRKLVEEGLKKAIEVVITSIVIFLMLEYLTFVNPQGCDRVATCADLPDAIDLGSECGDLKAKCHYTLLYRNNSFCSCAFGASLKNDYDLDTYFCGHYQKTLTFTALGVLFVMTIPFMQITISGIALVTLVMGYSAGMIGAYHTNKCGVLEEDIKLWILTVLNSVLLCVTGLLWVFLTIGK